MSFAIKLSDILVFRDMPVLTGGPDSCEIFPITINFVKSISDRKLQQLAILAKWVQDNEKDTDTAPVIHARWIDNKESIIGEIIERNCSLCGHRTTGLYNHFFPYCPNCGAKMDGERTEE